MLKITRLSWGITKMTKEHFKLTVIRCSECGETWTAKTDGYTEAYQSLLTTGYCIACRNFYEPQPKDQK